MFEVICREIKIMLVDTWVLGLTLEVCLIYFLGMAVLSNWQNNKAISVGFSYGYSRIMYVMAV